ncbi:hypothetical protein TNCV_2492011 [Trichonephila clavipes]|nr:hypothetical protein TNCV_2492011 [Trichonephila clavipes]
MGASGWLIACPMGRQLFMFALGVRLDSPISGLSCWIQSKDRIRLDAERQVNLCRMAVDFLAGNSSSRHSSKFMSKLKSRCPPMSTCA